MNSRLAGLLLFLPVPLVLWLFTRMPLGLVLSLVLGAAIMLTHALYARPFVLTRARSRCLWCGGEISPDTAERHEVLVAEPRGLTCWTACTPHHLRRLQNTLGAIDGHRLALRFGILGSIVLFFGLAAAAGFGAPAGVRPGDATAVFRLGVALTVLPLGWLGPHARPRMDRPPAVPFPMHLQALIGTLAVLWLFRLVGLLWLAQGGWALLQRFRGGS